MAINLPKLPFKLPHLPFDRLGPRTRKILRYVGFSLFAIIVFVFALQLTFPYNRVKDKVIEAMSEKYDVTISSVERGWMPGRVYFHGFSIRTRQTKPDETINQFYIDTLEVDVGILALLGGNISVDFDAKIGDRKIGFGHLSGNLQIASFGKGSITASVEGDSLPGDALPMRAALGLPMTGKLDFDINTHLPVEKSKLGKTSINWQKATGSLTLKCPNSCTFGDGKTKLKPLLKNTRNQVMVGEGIDFGKVTMDTLLAKATMKGGKLVLDKFDTTSKDGVLKIEYMMTLEKNFDESMVAGCLRFKGSDDLLRREPKTHAAISTTGAELRSDGLFHIRLTDRFKDMKRLNQECGPGTNTNNGEDFSRSNRPNLTVQPEEAAKPSVPIPPPTPTPTIEPPPATPPITQPGSAAPGSGAGSAPPGAAPIPTGSPGETRGGGDNRGERGSDRGSDRGDHPPPSGPVGEDQRPTPPAQPPVE
ncbi:MAG TPA: type II secretion system protein GspN [Kofleriaceae bacterium]|nr:type II secretion system protein GspN [Kofleriaceae bacterium]